MDNDFFLDYDEIIKTVKAVDVVTIRFVTLNQRLLVDSRTSEMDAPLMKIVPRARSAKERFRSLKQLRPRFRLPERISAIWWPKSVNMLVERRIWDAITQRFAESGFSGATCQCDDVLEELRSLERQEIRDAVSGEGYHALWER